MLREPLVKEWLSDFVQETYSARVQNPCNHQSMDGSGTSDKATLKRTEVTFSIEVRPSTSAQLEAGKRLFEKLVKRAQSCSLENYESRQDDRKR